MRSMVSICVVVIDIHIIALWDAYRYRIHSFVRWWLIHRHFKQWHRYNKASSNYKTLGNHTNKNNYLSSLVKYFQLWDAAWVVVVWQQQQLRHPPLMFHLHLPLLLAQLRQLLIQHQELPLLLVVVLLLVTHSCRWWHRCHSRCLNNKYLHRSALLIS